MQRASQVALFSKDPPASAGEIEGAGSSPWWEDPMEEMATPLQHSLENPRRGAQAFLIYGVANLTHTYV